MAQTPTAFDTTVLVDPDSDNGMKYKMPRHGPHIPWSPMTNRRNGDHARRPSPPSDLEDSDDSLAANVQSEAIATVQVQILEFKRKHAYFNSNSHVQVSHCQTITDQSVTVYNQIKIISQTTTNVIILQCLQSSVRSVLSICNSMCFLNPTKKTLANNYFVASTSTNTNTKNQVQQSRRLNSTGPCARF